MFVLGGFQIASHLTNYNANGVLEAIRSKAYVKGRIFPIIGPNEDGTGDTLRICDDIPQSNTDNTCVPIVDAPSNNQRPKPKQDQGAATTQDVFEALSDALYAPKTGEIRVLATLPANIPSTVTTSGAADTTNVANRPVVPGTTAVRPSQVPSPASSANGKQVCLLAAVSQRVDFAHSNIYSCVPHSIGACVCACACVCAFTCAFTFTRTYTRTRTFTRTRFSSRTRSPHAGCHTFRTCAVEPCTSTFPGATTPPS